MSAANSSKYSIKVGDQFGDWMIIGGPERRGGAKWLGIHWLCECSCPGHTQSWVSQSNLLSTNGHSGSRGCVKCKVVRAAATRAAKSTRPVIEPRPRNPRPDTINLIGQKYRNWTVIGLRVTDPERLHIHSYPCRCDCGAEEHIRDRYLTHGRGNSCLRCCVRGTQLGDLTGKKFGNWTAVCRLQVSEGSSGTVYDCICDCGFERPILASLLNLDRAPRCPECIKEVYKRSVQKAFWSRFLSHAESRGLEVEFSEEWVWSLLEKQNWKCALSGVDLTVATNATDRKNGVTTASIDRVNSDLGYTRENTKFVHKDLNRMKSDFPEPHFVEWCRLVASHHDAKAQALKEG